MRTELPSVVQASTTGRDRVTQGEKNRNSRNMGRLLERGLQATLPATHFPFAVRLNVDLLSGDGSEAMAALSASSLALADAGVAVQAHVAGLRLPAFGRLRMIWTFFASSGRFCVIWCCCHRLHAGCVGAAYATLQVLQYLICNMLFVFATW